MHNKTPGRWVLEPRTPRSRPRMPTQIHGCQNTAESLQCPVHGALEARERPQHPSYGRREHPRRSGGTHNFNGTTHSIDNLLFSHPPAWGSWLTGKGNKLPSVPPQEQPRGEEPSQAFLLASTSAKKARRSRSAWWVQGTHTHGQ